MADSLSTAASVAGLLGFVIQSIQVLFTSIGNIHGAPEDVQNIRNDLQALVPVLNQLNSATQDHTLELALGNEICDALKNTERVCTKFNESLNRWMEHSTPGKPSQRDRWKIGLFKQERMKTLRGQLVDCKETLNITLQTATLIKTSRQNIMTKDMVTQLLQGLETRLKQQLMSANVLSTELERRVQESPVIESNDRDRQELVEELRHQQDSNNFLRKTCEEALKRTVSERTGQHIRDVRATDHGVALAGFVNAPQSQEVKHQDIAGISADGHSMSFAGVVNGVDFAALAAAMRTSP